MGEVVSRDRAPCPSHCSRPPVTNDPMTMWYYISNVAPRRENYGILHRGLKPTVTITQPLRGGECGDYAAKRQPKVAGRFNARNWRENDPRHGVAVEKSHVFHSHNPKTICAQFSRPPSGERQLWNRLMIHLLCVSRHLKLLIIRPSFSCKNAVAAKCSGYFVMDPYRRAETASHLRSEA